MYFNGVPMHPWIPFGPIGFQGLWALMGFYRYLGIHGLIYAYIGFHFLLTVKGFHGLSQPYNGLEGTPWVPKEFDVFP